MLRIVDGIVFEGKPAPDRFVVSLRDFGNGHREACVQRAIDWVEDGPLDPDSIAAQVLRGEREDPNAAEKAEANRRRAARRAKTNIRHRCKVLGLDTLLTLTYKSNQTDGELADLHLKLFLEKVRKAFRAIDAPEFCYVGIREPQKRGAWHWHLAVHRLPAKLLARNGVKVKSFNVIRALWRAVTGEHGGNVDVGRWKLTSRKSPAKCASYLSKYVAKTFTEGELHEKRYRWSRCGLPQAIRHEISGAELRELIRDAMLYACNDGRVVASTWFPKWGDVFYIATEASEGVLTG